jgi:hypothetical protein
VVEKIFLQCLLDYVLSRTVENKKNAPENSECALLLPSFFNRFVSMHDTLNFIYEENN